MKKADEVTQGSAARNKKSPGFSVEEQAAMKARAKELKAEARMSKNKEEGEKAGRYR